MQFLKVGHHTEDEKGTGVTVFLFDRPAIAAYQLAGSAPASSELAVLDLESSVSHIDGLVFVGGSAFGLGAVSGVMRWLQEQGRGHPTPYGAIPIVPAAGIFDLAIKDPLPPTSDNAYQACITAEENNFSIGSIGAGTGASIGKLVTGALRMSGGVGCAELTFQNGLQVIAYAVVNCVGDVHDRAGKIIAGARLSNGEFANCEHFLLSGNEDALTAVQNTTLVAVFTNALFSKAALKRIAKVAISGMARTISPVFTRYDGDILFCASLGERLVPESMVSVMAAEVVRQAIINAVKYSKVITL